MDRTIWKRAAVGAMLLLVLVGSLSAQVINTEKKRLESDKNGWDGNVDLGFSIVQNTKSIVQLTNRINVEYRKAKHTVLLLNDLSIMSVNQDRLLNRGFQHARYNYEWNSFLIPEAFVQAQYNQIWKIDVRMLAGAGPRFRIMRTDSSRLYVGSLVMYEYEEVDGGSQYNRDFRLSSYVSAGYHFSKVFGVDHITYFQPKLNDWADFRLSTETSLNFSVTERLAFKTIFSLSYDTRPPVDLRNTFYSLSNSLSFNF